jgi:hypothetical protein
MGSLPDLLDTGRTPRACSTSSRNLNLVYIPKALRRAAGRGVPTGTFSVLMCLLTLICALESIRLAFLVAQPRQLADFAVHYRVIKLRSVPLLQVGRPSDQELLNSLLQGAAYGQLHPSENGASRERTFEGEPRLKLTNKGLCERDFVQLTRYWPGISNLEQCSDLDTSNRRDPSPTRVDAGSSYHCQLTTLPL